MVPGAADLEKTEPGSLHFLTLGLPPLPLKATGARLGPWTKWTQEDILGAPASPLDSQSLKALTSPSPSPPAPHLKEKQPPTQEPLLITVPTGSS